MSEHSRDGVFLVGPQLTMEENINFPPRHSFVLNFDHDRMRFEEIGHLFYASSRETNEDLAATIWSPTLLLLVSSEWGRTASHTCPP